MAPGTQFRQEILAFFLEQGRKMGNIAMDYFGMVTESDVHQKAEHVDDPVTIADTEIRDHIVPVVEMEFGKRVLLLTEESATAFSYTQDELLRMGKPIMIIDELDGTKNFKDGRSHFSVLLGLAELTSEGYQMTVGVVYAPITEETFYATIDTEAIYRPIHGLETKLTASSRDRIIKRQTPVNVAIGRETFPLDYPDDYMVVTRALEQFRFAHMDQVARYAKFSCGLELMDIARGDVDLFLCAKAANWDYAAASLILQQAGGKAYLAKSTDMLTALQPWSLQLDAPANYYPAFFTNGKIDDQFSEYVREYLPE